MARERVVFDFNVPVTIALEYPEGKEVESRFNNEIQYQWTITENRIAWVEPLVEAKRKALGLKAGVPFEVCKRRMGRLVSWEVKRVDEDDDLSQHLNQSLDVIERGEKFPGQPGTRPIAQATTQQEPSRVIRSQATTAGTRAGKVMAGALMASVDALLETKTYAASKGMILNFNEEDVRACAITFYIQHSKELLAREGAA